MLIRKALSSELNETLAIERAAFDSDEEANLVVDLLGDVSAKPVVSLLAFHRERAVGHVLFSKVRLDSKSPLTGSILAPLAVVPDAQNQGVGGKLIQYGLRVLADSATDLVFVLGYPGYYSRFGFKPAGRLGFEAPYPIPAKNADAWMVQELRPNTIGRFRGKIICADKLNKPEYWRE